MSTLPLAPIVDVNSNGHFPSSDGLIIPRYFTDGITHPYDTLEWETRTAEIIGADGEVIFRQEGVEFPASWSQQATNIVAQKYFRGPLGSPEREHSVKQMIDRVVNTITNWGYKDGYFNEPNSWAFAAELTHILVNQMASFNSPVWFNIGVPSEKQQASACFILDVDDNLESIFNWYVEEGNIFANGSGSGTNLSKLRGKNELLSGGGKASGPLSFDRVADANGGVIKSGGKTRRSARMIILDVDHPDIEDFIDCKLKEEKKARVLMAAGYDASLDGEIYQTLAHQNGNYSVGVTNDFMERVEENTLWVLRNRVDGKEAKHIPAKDLFRKIAQAAWECADPGIQFQDTMNAWHTSPHEGRITTTNPCLVGKTSMLTSDGWFPIRDLVGKPNVKFFDGENYVPGKAWSTGIKDIVRLYIQDNCGFETTLECTPGHMINVGSVYHPSWMPAAQTINLELPNCFSPHRPYKVMKVEPFVSPQVVYDFRVASKRHMGVANGILVHNCSEFIFLNNNACNLSSINLIKFLMKDQKTFDIKSFTHTVDMMVIAKDILVGRADYPTEKITEQSHKYRTIGLGYTNLGGLLMVKGLPYDSDEGRNYAASITALMTGEAYLQSAKLAEKLGAFPGYSENRESMFGVIKNHYNAIPFIDHGTLPDANIWMQANNIWAEAESVGYQYGYRNAQVALLAPTGTISFVMDAATTGVEPEMSLIKYKKLSGGGTLKMVNPLVEQALQNLNYAPSIIPHYSQCILKDGSLERSGLFEQHKSVFDCAFPTTPGGRSIAWEGHVKMVAAVQPFLSGGVSKSINMPHDATVEDVERAYTMAWKLGLKSISIYRDGCKFQQPVTTQQETKPVYAIRSEQGLRYELTSDGKHMPVLFDEDKAPEERANKFDNSVNFGAFPTISPMKPLEVRRRLPAERPAITHKYALSGHEGYVTVGLYEDGSPGEVFLKMSKEGSTIAGLMDTIATLTSLALQYGVPLQALVDKFSHVRFEPSGFTGNKLLPVASSLVDYIFRWLGQKFLTEHTTIQQSIPLHDVPTASEQSVPSDAPLCSECGSLCRRSGSCYVCECCGSSTGCN